MLVDTAGSPWAYPMVCSGGCMGPILMMRDARPRGNVPVPRLCVQKRKCMRSVPIMGPEAH